MDQTIEWRAKWKIHKYRDSNAEHPYDCVEGQGNLLMYGGASALWDLLIGAANVTAFDNSNAYLGVGTGTTASSASQTDLQGGSTDRQGMETSYPDHTDGTSESNSEIEFKSEFGSSDANFSWEEWGLFNASTDGRMLNRKVVSMGTKADPEVWTLTVTLSLA